MIAATCLAVALVLAGKEKWPRSSARPVAIVALLLGVTYTTSSEWVNVSVR